MAKHEYVKRDAYDNVRTVWAPDADSYSWLAAIIGPLYYMYRGQWLMAVAAAFLTFYTYGLGCFLLAFWANTTYIRQLEKDGWERMPGPEDHRA